MKLLEVAAAIVVTHSADETEKLGFVLGEAAFAGCVLLLEGPLGAGKTVLTRGVARGLGATGGVSSPSFTLLQVYEGRLPLFHLDLYRVDVPDELRSLDLDEILGARAVTVVEWPRWLLERPPAGNLQVRIALEGEGSRRIELRAHDSRWEETIRALA